MIEGNEGVAGKGKVGESCDEDDVIGDGDGITLRAGGDIVPKA
jgi:hypothetical protein